MTVQSRTSGISTGWESAHQLHNQAPMTDLLLFIVIVAFFAACIAYVRAMDRI
jgi:Fe2+ transport system protein B